MWYALTCFLIAGIALLCWAVIKGEYCVRLLAVFVALCIASLLSYSLGEAWGTMVYYDRYGYPLSQISRRLAQLAEHQQISELTNDVMLLDSKFNPEHGNGDLQDAMLQILKVGKYYHDTNTIILPQTTNTEKSPNHS